MLKPSLCFVGPISAAEQMTLILPRSQYEQRALLFTLADKKFAVMLDSPFHAFERDGNASWRGLHIPDVHIELDPASVGMPDGHRAPLGSLTRHGTLLSINSQSGQMRGWTNTFPVMDGLPPCIDEDAACFLKWQIVIGEGIEKQVLHQVDVTPKA